jgi:hypothetical protein
MHFLGNGGLVSRIDFWFAWIIGFAVVRHVSGHASSSMNNRIDLWAVSKAKDSSSMSTYAGVHYPFLFIEIQRPPHAMAHVTFVLSALFYLGTIMHIKTLRHL